MFILILKSVYSILLYFILFYTDSGSLINYPTIGIIYYAYAVLNVFMLIRSHTHNMWVSGRIQ